MELSNFIIAFGVNNLNASFHNENYLELCLAVKE